MPRTFDVHRTEIDGVPTFWADTSPGPFVGSLMFRVGRSDEPPAWGGVTHLVEHLVLAPLGQQSYDHNGFVEPNRTIFVATGDPEEVVTFLGTVAKNLAAPPLDRILIERRILRQEEEQGGPSIGGAVRWYRFGMTAHGQVGEDQAGLNWIGPDIVGAWVRRWFNRQNAALILSGPPPAGITLTLPEGERQPSAPVEPIADVELPARVPWDGPGTTLGLLMERQTASTVLLSIVDRRARQKLRFERGLVYDVISDYDLLDARLASAVVGSDCPPDRVPEVTRLLLEVFDQLAADGPTTDEIAAEATAFRRQFADRDAQIGLLDQLAENTLLGGPTPDPDEALAKREALAPGDVAAVLGAAMPSLLLLAGGDGPHDPRFKTYPASSSRRVAGTEYRPAGLHLPGRGPKERIVVGADGIAFVGSPTEVLTVRFDDCVLVQHHAPGIRLLWGRDGDRVGVDASAWKDGQRIIEAIDRAVPAEIVACEEHGIGALADPEQEPAAAS